MSKFFGGLISTPAPIIGIAFIALFAIVGLMVGPDYDGMNAPALGDTKKPTQDWLVVCWINHNQKIPGITWPVVA